LVDCPFLYLYPMQPKKKSYTVQEALKAMEHYCAYQERCHKEVETKLRNIGMFQDAQDLIILHLLQENFLNEERFSKAFARGKFNIKKWGRVRISNELKFRNISTYNIKSAMKEIEEVVYFETLEVLAQKKWEATREPNHFKKKKKVIDFLLRRGFESSLVFEVTKNICNE